MEDILASIRRILSEDTPPDGDAPARAEGPGTAPAVPPAEDEADDVAPFTASFDDGGEPDEVHADAGIDEAPPQDHADEPAEPFAGNGMAGMAVVNGGGAFAPGVDMFAAATSGPSTAPREKPDEDVLVLSPEMRAPSNASSNPPGHTSGHTLVSDLAAVSSTDVLSMLARAILDRRDMVVTTRDVTLEGMVREMLRPLLHEWLDRNLPYLIERLVRKEIDLMVNRAERLED